MANKPIAADLVAQQDAGPFKALFTNMIEFYNAQTTDTATIASGSAVAIGAAAGRTILVTGNTTITAFDSVDAGITKQVIFGAALTLTHNATSLILPGGANITTAAGDAAIMLSLGSGNWRCIAYQKADGTALVGGGFNVVGMIPAHYERSRKWAQKGSDTAANRRTVVSPDGMTVNINNGGYGLTAAAELDINTAGNWDSTATDYTDPANRAGKNFYVYACVPSSGTIPDLKLSANSTVPTGYTATNSRKIGGFHTLCTAVGTISGHALTGYLQGDILPASVWDLRHRPAANPEGMVYDAGTNKWVDIYLSSVSSGELASVNGAVVADGVSSPAFHWYKLAQWLSRVKKRMLYQHEFVSASLGANQGTNITGSADPNTTAGHTDTAGRRMISNIGCEDTCGAYYQWGSDSLSGGSDAWANAYDANDSGVAGQHYRPANRVLLGGGWADGAACGSRCSLGADGPLTLSSAFACRGCAEPGIPLS